ncbi:1820_t:CDS:2, partial [Dentiscutata heterogama]
SRVHKQNNNHISLLFTDSSRIYCALCPGKSYKNLQGLSQHESLIYSNYNISWAGLMPQPPEAISEFKKTLVFLIQDKLKKGVATKSICKCIMLGNVVGVYETLDQIFKDSNWDVHEYKNQQQTCVILVSQDTNQIQPKMEIQWRHRQIKDEVTMFQKQ